MGGEGGGGRGGTGMGMGDGGEGRGEDVPFLRLLKGVDGGRMWVGCLGW